MANDLGKLPKGVRYNSLISYLGKLLAAGTPHEEIMTSGVAWARKWFDDIPEGAFDERLVRKDIQRFIDHGYETGTPAPTLTFSQSAPAQAPVIDISKWRDEFRSVGEMQTGPIIEVIKGVLQEGVCFIGANPGDGKTSVALSMAKAISHWGSAIRTYTVLGS